MHKTNVIVLNISYMDTRPYAVVNKTVLSLRLNSDVSMMALSSIGRELHARGPATEINRSLNLQLEVCKIMMTQHKI